MNLFELNQAVRDFELEIDEETGEILNADALDSLSLERDTSDERFIKYEPKISKSDIKDALKSGEIIKGARLVENNSLQIK